MSITIDLGFAFACGEEAQQAFDQSASRFDTHRAAVARAVASQELGFWDLPLDDGLAERINTFCDQLPQAIDSVVVLGIGGSSLGGRALVHALQGPQELAPRAGRRIFFPDNSDPQLLSELMGQLEPAQTLLIVISKSGGTVETAASLLITKKWLQDTLGEAWTKHVVIITDPSKGPLRELASEHKIATFEIPANVGGRFSVLTAVGLLPAALAGADPKKILAGARQCRSLCELEDATQNPAATLAITLVSQARLGQNIHVLMPYADALRPLSAWFVQLWAESLGKRHDRDGAKVEVGPTPLPAIGATDQHAQVQLFMEGPRDKFIIFVRVREPERDLRIPAEEGPFSYLGGKSLAALLDAEYSGTSAALAGDGRPSLTLELQNVCEQTMGALLFLFEAATAFAGEMYHINAFNQPGVEAGKRYAMGLLGRSGFENAREAVDDVLAAATPFRVVAM